MISNSQIPAKSKCNDQCIDWAIYVGDRILILYVHFT